MQMQICIVNICNSLPNLVINAFKACLDTFWSYQAAKFDCTADLNGFGN